VTVDLATGRAAPILVEFADRLGLGFKLLDKARRGELATMQDAAASLLKSAVGQPKLDTGTLPVHGLMYVSVAGRRYWCFHVQGRRGPFGAAGTCQFVFADAAGWLPGELWRWCQQRCADGPFQPTARMREAPAGGSSAAAQRVLRELATGRSRIALGIDAGAAGALLTGLLQVLPPDVVARYWWRTCLLEPPSRGEQPVVAGRWPDVLRERRGDQAERVDEWLGGSSRSLTAEQEKALGWLADFVAEPAADFAPPTAVRGMVGLLDWLAAAKLPVTLDQVEGLLEFGDPDARLVDAAPLVTLWAQRHPATARAHLLARTGGADVQKALFEGLWTATVTNRRDELHVPPAETTAEWRTRLTAAMRTRRDGDVAAIADDLAQLQQAGVVSTTDDGLVAARAWLTDLGLTAAAHPRFLPGTLADVRARFAVSGSLSAQDRAWLHARGDRLPADLAELAPYAQEPWPAPGMELVGLLVDAGRRSDVGPLAEVLLDTENTSLDRFTALAGAAGSYGDDVRRAVLRHGLRPLAARNSDLALPAELERDCITAFTDDAAAPAQVRHLLRGFDDRGQELAVRAREAEGRAEQHEARAREFESRAREFEGRAQEFEGRAQEFEGRAEQHEARAREFESRAREFEGRVQESEGRAQGLEAQVEELKAEVRQLAASRVPPSLDEPVSPVQPSGEDAELSDDPLWAPTGAKGAHRAPKLGPSAQTIRPRRGVAIALFVVLAILAVLAGAILWRNLTAGKVTNPMPPPAPTSTMDPSGSLLPTPTDPAAVTTPPTSGLNGVAPPGSPTPSIAPGGTVVPGST
jgi:hypothetical protein